jgi:hypothetical protein
MNRFRQGVARRALCRAAFAGLLIGTVLADTYAFGGTLSVSVSRFRVEPGDTVEVQVQVGGDKASSARQVQAVVLKPSSGVESLPLTRVNGTPGLYRAQLRFRDDAAPGLYAVHAWTGEQQQPTAVGKASLLLGSLITDFAYAGAIDQEQPDADFERYLDDFQAVGGNFLVAHGLIDPKKAHYPSKIAKTDVEPGSPDDHVETILRHADRRGIGVLLSISWDRTRQAPYEGRMEEIKAIIKEMYELYRHHPSLVGFYSYQEGSGTYLVPFIREFTEYVKSLDPNLLTACAPYVDDPLLAGYLATVNTLDIIIYQGMVMASYRPDNRKEYPLRRVRDFVSLGIGAKKLQNKIAITHVELFGYGKNRLAPDLSTTGYDNIYPQILSAATAADADGISFFTYQVHINSALRDQRPVERSRQAVRDGMEAYRLITSKISDEPNPLALYFPYSDWIIERWPNYYLPALDAFRTLGVPIDVLPYAPPLEESILPYYPFHLNEDVLARLLRERTILVLPNVSGFQRTDGDLIKAFVESGGVVVAFGPQIPTSRSYDRQELFGGDKVETKVRRVVQVRDAIGSRVAVGSRLSLDPVELPSWAAAGGRVVATFEDGTAAVLTNRYGKGVTVTILLDAETAARQIPDLVRDALDYAMESARVVQPVDILGTNENVDLAVRRLPEGFRVAIVNHNDRALELRLKPLKALESASRQWLDLVSNQEIGTSQTLNLRVPARDFRAVEYRRR